MFFSNHANFLSLVSTPVNDPVSNILKELKKMVEAPYMNSPNSTQFPRIPGPSKNEKVMKYQPSGEGGAR